MQSIRIRLELNKGRVGMPLHKLATVTSATRAFLDSLAEDLGLSTKEGWLAEAFENNSVDFDCRLGRAVEDDVAGNYREGLRLVLANHHEDSLISARIRPETRCAYARIAGHLDPDERAGLGVYTSEDQSALTWYFVDATLAEEIKSHVETYHRTYGEVQGIVHAFFKEADKPYLKIRELSTKHLVNCYFTEEQYASAVEVMSDRTAVVFVEGWLKESVESGLVDEIEVKDFRLAPIFSVEMYDRYRGRFPEYTGPTNSEEFVRQCRE
jgi:hypothetical protein